MTWIQALAIWFIGSVIAAPFVGQWLHNRRINAEWNQWLYDERQGRLERLQRNYDIADAITREDAYANQWQGDEDEQPHLPRAS